MLLGVAAGKFEHVLDQLPHVLAVRGGYRDGARAEYRGRSHRDHGWHRGHDKKVVIIKHGRDRRY